MKQRPLKVIHAAAVRDATGVNARPGAVLVQDGKVLAAGPPESLPVELVRQAEVIDRRDCLLLPGLVNAHTHLELTPIGPQPYDEALGFVGWVKSLRWQIPIASVDRRVEWVSRGADICKGSGVVAVGDIASANVMAEARAASGLDGQTYQELFGLGPPMDTWAFRDFDAATNGLQPHAPYSAGPRLYQAAVESGLPVSTHLAETLEEAEFVANGRGPCLDYLREVKRWSDDFSASYGCGLSPVQWMQLYLQAAASSGGWLVAHCNYVSDEDIAILADTNTSVAYCPIASEYFGHVNHRYREMLAAGVNVCLGTDSIVCQPPEERQPLGILAPMRRLYERDGTDPELLLRMATINGAKSLRLDGNQATLRAGAPAKFLCVGIDPSSGVDPLQQILTNRQPAEALWVGLTEQDA